MFNLEDYETVEERLAKFWKDHPTGRVETRLVSHTPTQYVFWAAVWKDANDAHAWATGHAEETVTGRGVNATSACENGETSALGRALANCGYATKGKRASREEMAKVKAKVDVEALVKETKDKMKQSSGEYVPVPNPDDPWSIVPTKQGQTLGEAVATLEQNGFAVLNPPPMRQCKCKKDMGWKMGEKKDGQPWGHYHCTNVPMRQCMNPIWYNLKNGQWVQQ